MTTAWAAVAGCAIVLAIPLGWRVWRRRFDPFEPLVLFALAWGAMFVARPASMLVEDERVFWGLDVFPTLPRALVLALLGAVAFVTAYELGSRRALARRLPEPRAIDPRIAAAAAILMTGVSLVALAIFLPLSRGADALRIMLGGRSHEFGELLQTSSAYVAYSSLLFGPAAVVLTGLALRYRRRWLALAATASLALILVRVLPAGGRIVLLPVIGAIFVLLYVVRGTRPRALVLAGLAFAALVVSFLALHLRDPTDDLTLRTAVQELRDRPHAVLDPVLYGADAEMVLALSSALTVIPDELSYRYGGATIGNLLARPVPREIWPGKPLPPSAAVVAEVWPQHYPALNVAFSPLLSFYWDFGLVGVAVGMALFGLLCRTFYEWFLLHRSAFAAQMLFAGGLWLVVIGARNDPVDTLVLAAFTFGPVLAAVVVASQGVLPSRSPSARGNASEAPRVREPGEAR